MGSAGLPSARSVPGPTISGPGPADHAKLPVGETKPVQAEPGIVATVDEPGDKEFWLMNVWSAQNDQLFGQYYSASKPDVRQAQFRLVHIER